MFEFTLQFLEDHDWIRVTAVYDTLEDARRHGADLLTDGNVVRMLARKTAVDIRWHTMTLGSEGQIALNRVVHSCPI